MERKPKPKSYMNKTFDISLFLSFLFFFTHTHFESKFFLFSTVGTEVLSKSLRVIFTTLGVFLHYCIGYMLLPGFAFGMRDWRPLLQILSGIMFVYIPLWW